MPTLHALCTNSSSFHSTSLSSSSSLGLAARPPARVFIPTHYCRTRGPRLIRAIRFSLRAILNYSLIVHISWHSHDMKYHSVQCAVHALVLHSTLVYSQDCASLANICRTSVKEEINAAARMVESSAPTRSRSRASRFRIENVSSRFESIRVDSSKDSARVARVFPLQLHVFDLIDSSHRIAFSFPIVAASIRLALQYTAVHYSEVHTRILAARSIRSLFCIYGTVRYGLVRYGI